MKLSLVLGLCALLPFAAGCIVDVDDPESDDADASYDEAELDIAIAEAADDIVVHAEYGEAVDVPIDHARGASDAPPGDLPAGDDVRQQLAPLDAFTSGEQDQGDEEKGLHGEEDENPDPTPWHASADTENPDPTPWR